MNLFDNHTGEESRDRPLAYKMRPQSIEELYGQDEIIGEGKLLRRAIEADRIQSLIFYGPPGSGKTSLARVIASSTEAEFIKLNAVTAGIKDIRCVIKTAHNNKTMYNKKTILFIDEIHRFNKTQQDALLPSVEKGTVIMIGATTENPYFEVNSPLLSRTRIYRLNPLQKNDIIKIINNALTDKKLGLGEYNLSIDDNTINYLAEAADGDARVALNALELAVITTPPDSQGCIRINKNIIADSLQQKILNYDQSGDNHYDTISAFIKSMRGSDPDASLFWLAKMIEAGEDPRFIARRIIVHAAEDVGLADPQALYIAVAAARAVEFVGMPEARIPLAEAVLYIATAPKSNSVIKGIDSALNYVRNNNTGNIPPHLRDTHYSGAKKMGSGLGYKYPHDYKNNYVQQQYLPDGLTDLKFYYSQGQGKEKDIKQRLDYFQKLVRENAAGEKKDE